MVEWQYCCFITIFELLLVIFILIYILHLHFVFEDCICISKRLCAAKLMRWVGGWMTGLTPGWKPFFRLI